MGGARHERYFDVFSAPATAKASVVVGRPISLDIRFLLVREWLKGSGFGSLGPFVYELRALTGEGVHEDGAILVTDDVLTSKPRVMRRHLIEVRRETFAPAWRRTFGFLGKAVGWSELEKIATVASVRTFQCWYWLVTEAPGPGGAPNCEATPTRR